MHHLVLLPGDCTASEWSAIARDRSQNLPVHIDNLHQGEVLGLCCTLRHFTQNTDITYRSSIPSAPVLMATSITLHKACSRKTESISLLFSCERCAGEPRALAGSFAARRHARGRRPPPRDPDPRLQTPARQRCSPHLPAGSPTAWAD